MNVSNRLAEALKKIDVDMAFGMPGGATLPLLEAFEAQGIDFVLCRNETSAGFMADAIFQLTGQVGVCVSTLGPGATNLLSGITQSWLERSRVLGLVGQVSPSILPMYTHQVIDQKAIFEPVCKGYERLHTHRPEEQIRLTLRNLLQGLSRPLMLEIAEDVATAPSKEVPLDSEPCIGTADTHLAQKVFDEAKRPLLLIGSEDLSIEAAQAIGQLSQQRRIPAFTTYRGKGLVDETSEFSMGSIGLSPVVDTMAQDLIAKADCIVAVGLDPVELRPNWLPGWPEKCTFINLSKHGQPDLLCTMTMDLRGHIPVLCEALIPGRGFQWEGAQLVEHQKRVREYFDDGPHGPAAMMRALQGLLPEDTILALDVGAHRITASHVWQCRKPRKILQSNGFSSMGVGLPMAIAAKLKFPKTCAVALCGDMGLWMALGELGVVQERELDLIVIYIADQSLSLIELKQERAGYGGKGVRFDNPNVEELAKAFGGEGHRVADQKQLESSVKEALHQGGLHLVELSVDASAYRKQM